MSIMLSVTNKPIMLSVVMLNVVMLNVVMLSVVMLNVVAPNYDHTPTIVLPVACIIKPLTDVMYFLERGKLECLSLSVIFPHSSNISRQGRSSP